MPAGDMLNVSGQMLASHVMNAKMQTVAAEEAGANIKNASDSVSSLFGSRRTETLQDNCPNPCNLLCPTNGCPCKF